MRPSVVTGASTMISEAGQARAAPEFAARGSGAGVDPDITVVPLHTVDRPLSQFPLFTPVPGLNAATDAIASSVRVNEAGQEQRISRVTASAVAPASSSLIKLAAEAQAEATAQSRKADALLSVLQMVSDPQRAMASVQAQGFSDAQAAETRIIQTVLSSQCAVAVGSVEAPANSPLSKEDDLRRPEKKARLVMAPITADTPRRDPCGWMSTDVTLAGARKVALLSDFKRAPEMEWGVMPNKTNLPQLVWIVKLCHTQAGVPGLFGAIAFGRLYRAQQHAASDAAGGAVGRVSYPAMDMSVARCSRNAEQYMRLLLWASNKLSHLLSGDPSKQTKESRELFDLDPETEGNTLF
ncbi:hypothetical protein I4F81_005670 [Pyropia yezoensis]|uniref:Uncharacterized protein n=1 Tax=Pyropia yezoensis TaxID=2788 RepID=A0ACC3BYZ1_PYRYE|nr:hypothetical protein I4F81_005670 [Neopyropia yezoensis]